MPDPTYQEALIAHLEALVRELRNSPPEDLSSAQAWIGGAMSRASASEESEVAGFARGVAAGSTGGAAAGPAGGAAGVVIPGPNSQMWCTSRNWCTSRYVCITMDCGGSSWC